MDVTETRHRNLLALLAELGASGVTKLKDQAQKLGALGSSYLSQLKAGKKMGDDTARKIEAALRRPHGWMDQPQWKIDRPSLPHSQSVRLDPEIVRDVARALHEVYRDELGKTYSLIDEPELFAEMYERVAALGDVDSRSNLIWLGSRITTLAQQGAPTDERNKDMHGKGAAQRASGPTRKKA
jgi:hypothetical protein